MLRFGVGKQNPDRKIHSRSPPNALNAGITSARPELPRNTHGAAHPLQSILEPIVRTYLAEVTLQRQQPNSTKELSYRDFLGKLLRECGQALGKNVTFTGEGRRIVEGRPDYTVERGAKLLGYIEAEALDTPLAQLKGSAKAQNARFIENLPNFLLTNHYEFVVYRNGQKIAEASFSPLPSEGAGEDLKIPTDSNTGSPPLPSEPKRAAGRGGRGVRAAGEGTFAMGEGSLSEAALDAFQTMLEAFLDFEPQPAGTAEEIAKRLAKRARVLKSAALEELKLPDSQLKKLWFLYKETLFESVTEDEFADLYAQTYAYGVLLLWLGTEGLIFDREHTPTKRASAAPPVHVLLKTGGGDDLPEAFEWIVNGIYADLEAADRAALLKPKAGVADPFIQFYEPFLAQYDPALRKSAGVYYTPDSVTDFIIRAVDHLLKRDFDKDEGLADPSVKLLDPATGTGTFLARAYRQVHETMLEERNGAFWTERAKTHLAKNFYGFERLPAAYTLAHIKLRLLLTTLGVELTDKERLPIYLADTMMNRVPEQSEIVNLDVLTREIREAAKARDAEKILVVVGNPPYSGNSSNPSKTADGKLTFIGGLIQDYYSMDGRPLGEKNPKWLQNDYVKFIRFAQSRIERTGAGIVAFITDNSYLDNPTFRGMRRSLMQSFDEIYLIDLHGNSKKKETAPDGSKDENVFDITQGVSIALMIRRTDKPAGVIHHLDVYGSRKSKYDLLKSASLDSLPFTELSPNTPAYLFIPQEQEARVEYEKGTPINQVFPINTIGIVTGQDNNALAYSLEDAKILARNANVSEDKIIPIYYKPLDLRQGVYDASLITRNRAQVMRHLLDEKNVAFIFTRSASPIPPYTHVFASRHGVLGRYFVDAACITYFAPLYKYPTENEAAMGIGREPNLSPAFMAALNERIESLATPEEVFHYAYAVFHAPTYRTRYAEFLKTDFPRLPLPRDAESFETLAAFGAKLVALHLLESPDLKKHGIGYPVAGSHTVKKRKAAERWRELPSPPDPLSNDKLLLTGSQDFPAARSLGRGGEPELETVALPSVLGVTPTGNADASASPLPSEERTAGRGARGEGFSSSPLPSEGRTAGRGAGGEGRIYLNDTQYFEGVPRVAWEYTVGGYRPAVKWLEDRTDRILTEADILHYRRMIAALRLTSELLPEIDAAFIG